MPLTPQARDVGTWRGWLGRGRSPHLESAVGVGSAPCCEYIHQASYMVCIEVCILAWVVPRRRGVMEVVLIYPHISTSSSDGTRDSSDKAQSRDCPVSMPAASAGVPVQPDESSLATCTRSYRTMYCPPPRGFHVWRTSKELNTGWGASCVGMCGVRRPAVERAEGPGARSRWPSHWTEGHAAVAVAPGRTGAKADARMTHCWLFPKQGA